MSTNSFLDEMMRVLANPYRRQLLAALLEEKPQEALNLLIPEDVHTGEKELERLQTQMLHNHLPRLEEMGVIRWDAETQTVSKGPRFREIRPLLELMQARQQDRHPDV